MAVATAQREGPGRLAQWREGIRRLVRRSWSFFGGLALSALAIFALVALITYHPSDPSLNTDAAGPVRNWMLDQRGLDSLLLDRQRIASRMNGHRLVLPGLEESGRALPSLANSGQRLPGLARVEATLERYASWRAISTGFDAPSPCTSGPPRNHSLQIGHVFY